MQIGGLQKLTLIDYPKKIACTIFLFGCNFKCGFCHNPELVLPAKEFIAISEEEILKFLEDRKKYLDGVCISGGEPLLNLDLPVFLEKIKKIGYSIKIDTNGSNPRLLKEIIDKRLADYIAMDIKSDEDNYGVVTCIEVDIEKIKESIKIIADSGLDYELRTTAVPGLHNIENIKKIAEWVNIIAGKNPKKYIIQKFIPRKNKMIDDKFEKIEPFSHEDLANMKKAVESYFEEVEIRG